MVHDHPDPLFCEYDLRSGLENQEREMQDAIERYPAEALTQEPEDQLVAHFIDRFGIDAPVLTEGAISVAAEETKVDVSGSFDRDTFGQSPYYVPGMRVTYHVPFVGEADLFKCVPSTHGFNPPRADIVSSELQFRYDRADAEVAATKTDFDAELQKVRLYLGWVSNDVRAFNASLPAKIRATVSERRGRLERAQAGLQALGLPVRQQTHATGASTKANTTHPAVGVAPAPAPPKPTYDVSLSFAGENRDYVERVAEVLKQADVTVFYDGFEKAVLWGKNLIDHLADIYQHRSRFVVMFISKYYVEKAFPTHERQQAQARALVAREEYILPARFDDTEVPGLPSTVAYADLRKVSSEELADLILVKLGRKRR